MAEIFSLLECEYNGSILKKKMHSKDIMPHEQLNDIFEKALYTLKVQMGSLNLD